MESKSEIELIEGLVCGEGSVLDEIYERYGRRVYGFIYRMTRDQSIAEDITHETFLVLIEHPERYSASRGSLITFLCAIARNSVLNHLRRRYNSDDDLDDLDVAENGSGSDPLAGLIAQELAGHIDACIAALPPLQREVLILREYEELSCEQIASITETEMGTVKARLYRARQNLALALRPYVGATKKDRCYELR